MWKLEPTDLFERKVQRLEKKNPRELSAVLQNLQRYLNALNEAGRPEIIKFGFIHHEPKGVKAIDQKGGGRDLKQTRLYTYAQISINALHLITIGDKGSQKRDLRICRDFVSRIKKSESQEK